MKNVEDVDLDVTINIVHDYKISDLLDFIDKLDSNVINVYEAITNDYGLESLNKEDLELIKQYLNDIRMVCTRDQPQPTLVTYVNPEKTFMRQRCPVCNKKIKGTDVHYCSRCGTKITVMELKEDTQ